MEKNDFTFYTKISRDLLASMVVRPIFVEESDRWNQLMRQHHYLGFGQTVGEAIKYVSTLNGEWVSLLAWTAAALHVPPRDKWIGWDARVRDERLFLVVNNTRFLILPDWNIKNLASAILSRCLKRLRSDWILKYDHDVWLAETFVDPARFNGTCYKAGNWQVIGLTRGFSRVPNSQGVYIENGQPKIYLCYPLVHRCKERLGDPYFLDQKNRKFFMMDFKSIPMDGKNGLFATLKKVSDSRRRQGRRHSNRSILGAATCAILSGARSFRAIHQWASNLTRDQIERLRFRNGKTPSESTFQRVLRNTNAAEFDGVVGTWLLNVMQGGSNGRGVAVDGKVLKGSFSKDKKPIHLLSALFHEEGVVVAQRKVADKENEINGFKPLLSSLDLEDMIITADAIHCQQSHAEFLVNDKKADFLFTVKENQPKLRTLIESALNDTDRPIASESQVITKAHGRIEERNILVKSWTSDLANQHAFPYIAQCFSITRKWCDLGGENRKSETRFFITSSDNSSAAADELLSCVLDHWRIENSSHYVRDEIMGEDKSRVRKGQASHVMATLRNLAIGIIRMSGEKSIASGQRHFGWNSKHLAIKVIGA